MCTLGHTYSRDFSLAKISKNTKSCSLASLHDFFMEYLIHNRYWERFKKKKRQWHYLYCIDLMISGTKREVIANVTTGRLCMAVTRKQRGSSIGRRAVFWASEPQNLIIWYKPDTSSGWKPTSLTSEKTKEEFSTY